jgi:MATE family, multidrug efflux pump
MRTFRSHCAAAMMEPADPTMQRAPVPPSSKGGRGEIAASVSIALPLALTNLGNIAINTTDVVMVGWLGAEMLAAGMLGFILNFLFLLGGIGLTSSVPALTAQAHGGGDARAVRRTIRQGLWVSVLYSVPSIAILMHGETILLALGQDPTAARLAGEYLTYAAWSLPFILGIMVLRALLATLDRAPVIFWITCLGIVLNIVINYGFIFGNWGLPRLEIVGAGVATTATSAIGFAIFAVYVVIHPATRGYQVFRRLWRADFERLMAIVRIGTPVAFTALLEEGLFMASTLMVGWLGPLTLAGHTIALQCASVAYMIPVGIAQAGTVRVGLAAGRGDSHDIGRAGWTAMTLGLAVMSCAALAFWFVPEPLARQFLDSADPHAAEVLAVAVSLLGVAAFFQLFDGAQVVGLGILRGLNDTRVPLAYALFGYWGLGAPLAYILGFVAGYGAVGIWIGFIVGLGTVAILSLMRFSARDRLGLVAKVARKEA